MARWTAVYVRNVTMKCACDRSARVILKQKPRTSSSSFILFLSLSLSDFFCCCYCSIRFWKSRLFVVGCLDQIFYTWWTHWYIPSFWIFCGATIPPRMTTDYSGSYGLIPTKKKSISYHTNLRAQSSSMEVDGHWSVNGPHIQSVYCDP